MRSVPHSFQSDRLVMRRCNIDDAAALAALMTPGISRWVAAWPYPLSLQKARGMLAEYIDLAQTGACFPAIIHDRASGAVIGWLKLDISGDDGTRADLGYWIGEAFQRRGYAFEVSQAAIAFAFTTLGLTEMRAGAQVGNTASHALLAKLGMARDGRAEIWAPARQRYEACDFWLLRA